MTDDFEQRLAAAKERALAAQRKREEQRAAERAAGSSVSGAIADLRENIEPLVRKVVAQANEALTGSRKHLAIGTVNQSTETWLPSVWVYEGPDQEQGAPFLSIRVQKDGSILIHCANYDGRDRKYESQQIHEEQIRTAVADFVDAIITS